MKTHRCEGSLKAHMSIRYGRIMPIAPKVWNLCKRMNDFDYDSAYLLYCCTIDYCPFCGKQLTKQEVTTDA